MKSGSVILFCGLPATLKTYLAVRLSGHIGYSYIPTNTIRQLKNHKSQKVFERARINRYKELAKVVQATTRLGANIIIDGGFPSSESRSIILKKIPKSKVLIIYCIADESTRFKRLKIRSSDRYDIEQTSASSILSESQLYDKTFIEDPPNIKFEEENANLILTVNTTRNKLKWSGRPPAKIAKKINALIRKSLIEYKENNIKSNEIQTLQHFNSFANRYDEKTEWRKNQKLLQSLFIKKIPKPSRILDIGAGTGLASEQYSKAGHLVTGVDISPEMLRKASERINLVLLSNGTKLPFLGNYFDIIIVRQCLHYVEPLSLLNEAYRILKPGGRIVVSSIVCSSNDTRGFWKEFKNVTQPLRTEVFTSNDLCQLLIQARFKVNTKEELSLIRSESMRPLKQRSIPIAGGFLFFIKSMQQLASVLFPEIEFKVALNKLSYRQYWVTIWAQK